MHRLFGLLSLIAPMAPLAAHAQAIDNPGDTYEVRLERNSETSGDGSSGSSHDVWTLTERVVAPRDGGVELEFDLPASTSAEERAQTWQYPVRVFRPAEGPLQLVNGAELETRVHAWLQRFNLTEAACGHWVFTWNAFKIECDPDSVLETLQGFDLRQHDLHAGAPYSEMGARAPTHLRADGVALVAEMEIDPDGVRRSRAESDVVVAEIMQRPPLTLDAAIQSHASEQISGTIITRFEPDALGRVTRRIQTTNVAIVAANGSQERVVTTTTTQRRLETNTDPTP